MLSYGLMGCWQAMQWEPGNTIDCPAGMRKMHTLRKLPTIAPNTVNTIPMKKIVTDVTS